jgi:predicted NUDIX family NTP pyrophosphohydrolase
MPSAPAAGLLLYRADGLGLQVLLFRRARRGGQAGRTNLTIPYWELQPSGPTDRSFKEQPVERERPAKPRVVAARSPDQLLNHARLRFAELTGVEPEPPFLPLGGVKMRLHRIVYVWAGSVPTAEFDGSSPGARWLSVENSAAGSARPFECGQILPLAEARGLIEPQQRRFLDQLEGLLAGSRDPVARLPRG